MNEISNYNVCTYLQLYVFTCLYNSIIKIIFTNVNREQNMYNFINTDCQIFGLINDIYNFYYYLLSS